MTNAWRPRFAPDGSNNFGDGAKDPEAPNPDDTLSPIPPTGPSGPGKSVGFRSTLVRRRKKLRERLRPDHGERYYWRRRNA